MTSTGRSNLSPVFQARIPLEHIGVRSESRVSVTPILEHLKQKYGKVDMALLAILPHNFIQGSNEVLGWFMYDNSYVSIHSKYISNFETVGCQLGKLDKKDVENEIRHSQLILDRELKSVVIWSFSKPMFRFKNKDVPFFPLGIFHVLPDETITEAKKNRYRIHVGSYEEALPHTPCASPYGTESSPAHFYALTHIPIEYYAVERDGCTLKRTLYIDLRDLRNLTPYFEHSNLMYGKQKGCSGILQLFDAMRIFQGQWFFDTKRDLIFLPCLPRVGNKRVGLHRLPFYGQNMHITNIEDALTWTSREERLRFLKKHFPDSECDGEEELAKRFKAARSECTGPWCPGRCIVRNNVAQCFLPE